MKPALKKLKGVTHQRQLKAKQWSPAKGLYDCDQPLFDWVLSPLNKSDKQLFGQIFSEPRENINTKKPALSL